MGQFGMGFPPVHGRERKAGFLIAENLGRLPKGAGTSDSAHELKLNE